MGTAHKKLAIGHSTSVARAANGIAILWAATLGKGAPIGISATGTVAGTTIFLAGGLGDGSWPQVSYSGGYKAKFSSFFSASCFASALEEVVGSLISNASTRPPIFATGVLLP